MLFVPMYALGILVTTSSAVAALATVSTLVVLSGAYARTENLAVPIGVHAAYNALAVVIAFVVAGL